MSKPADLVQGTLDLLLLKILALEPLHGWAISLRLRPSRATSSRSARARSTRPSTSSSRRAGSRRSGRQTENNRRAKFYALTRLGRKAARIGAANWQRLSTAISQVVQLSEA